MEMDNLGLFKDWTPEMVEGIRTFGSRQSISARERWDNMSPKEVRDFCKNSFHSDEARTKSIETSRKRWKDMTPEQIEEHTKNTFHRPEAFKKSGKTRSENYSRIAKEEIEEYNKGRRGSIENFWGSPESEATRQRLSEAGRDAWASKAPEEKLDWLSRSCHSEESRKKAGPNIAEGNRRYWASLTKEERKARGAAILEGKIKSGNFGRAKSPTWPEIFTGIILERNFPGKWAYNGGGQQGVHIGNRTPDFIHRNGWKGVIEVFGVYYHAEDEVEEKIRYYKGYGYRCLVLWEYECYESYIVSEVKKLSSVMESELLGVNTSEPGKLPKGGEQLT